MAEASSDERYKVVLEEATRALAHQQTTIDNLRLRATLIVAVTALVTSFFGPQALATHHHLTWPAKAAIMAMILVIVCTFAIVWPRWKWLVRSSPTKMVNSIRKGVEIDEMREYLAIDFEKWHDQNEKKIAILQWLFVGALGFLLIELGCWIFQIKEW